MKMEFVLEFGFELGLCFGFGQELDYVLRMKFEGNSGFEPWW